MRKSTVLNPIQVVPFSYSKSYATTAQLATIPIYPAAFPRVLDIADGFDLFRVTKLRYRLLPPQSANGTTALSQRCAAAFYPGITDNPPGSVSDISENLTRAVTGVGQTTPSAWSDVPKELLRGSIPWYKTIVGSPEAADEIIGYVYAISDQTAGAVILDFEGIFEFKGSANTGATPMERSRRLALREKQRLLSVLTSSELGKPTGATVPQAALGLGVKP